MKKVLITFLFIIFVIILLLFLAQRDDELKQDAISFIERIDVVNDSTSFLYLYGVFAHESEDPIVVGKKRLDESRKKDVDNEYVKVRYDDLRKIPLPKGDVFCSTWDEGCLTTLFTSKIEAEKLLDEHKFLISRSDKFLEYTEYKTLTKPTLAEEIAPYHYLLAAERIKVLTAIETYKSGEPKQAVESLLLQFSKLRQALKLQDNLIGKLAILVKLNEIIDVSSIILFQENIRIDEIPLLTDKEKNFDMVAAREFALSFYMYKGLDKNPDFFKKGGNLPGWLVRVIYKPNMSINAVTPIFSRLKTLTRLQPSEFANEIKNKKEIVLSNSMLRNYSGGMLINLTPYYDSYAARVIDFDIKLQLFNHKFFLKKELNSMENPYYKGELGKESNGSFCFDGPLEDGRHIRCLKIKIQ